MLKNTINMFFLAHYKYDEKDMNIIKIIFFYSRVIFIFIDMTQVHQHLMKKNHWKGKLNYQLSTS